MLETVPIGVLAALVGLAGGLVLGLAARLGDFCTLGALESAAYGGDQTRLRLWGVVLAVAILATQGGAMAGLIDLSGTFYHALEWNALGSIVGGLVFGYGMALAVPDLPPALPMAVLATEDRRFYSHFGLDVFGLARAVAANIQAGAVVQGGSTITQQAAKNLFLTPERTIKRKVQELIISRRLEAELSKTRILELYLNVVEWGDGVWGAEAAAPAVCKMLATWFSQPNRCSAGTSRTR